MKLNKNGLKVCNHHSFGFNDIIYHEGNISKMPDFDVFSLLECKRRKSRSLGKRKNGNIFCAKLVLKNS